MWKVQNIIVNLGINVHLFSKLKPDDCTKCFGGLVSGILRQKQL